VFRGREGLKYDLHRLGGEPILASTDTISLHFKTRKSTGLLYYNGQLGKLFKFALIFSFYLSCFWVSRT
jgi:hypothetical protein